ncbi:HNH endonuclease signature motif containing protein [Microbacterium sp.]|uniref:HNH endonuclease signature motif containing protein n=1 Tax=Microbacterium sp. TaxID=51671 RepID=UPI002E353476|nr:DUF222 domain-containing protein [Microbacterium sp.]HEX5729857.1 DUF222 domain-containing protein [Microbacterium sp.]
MEAAPDFDPEAEACARPDDWHPPIPSALDLVIEADATISIHAAQRFARVDEMRRDALADASRHGYDLNDVIERSVRLELAAALAITEAAAGAMIAQADALVHRYPSVLESLAGARTTQRHAVDLVEAMDAVEPEFRGRLLPRALELAESLPVGTFRRQLRKLIESARSVTLTERHEHALQARRVFVENVDDGMAWLHALIPAVEVHAIHGRLTASAKVLAAHPDETRTLDQLRADVLCDILIDGVTDLLPSEARGIRPTAVVTVPALALLGAPGPGDDPQIASAEGVGPIPMDRARALCAGSAGWMRVLTHPETGMVLSVGRERYRPPPELRRLVQWRAETCMGPGCNIPAARCEIDHNVAWEHGGETSLNNLTPLCKGHHTIKHHGRWRVEQIADSGGALLWTSPAGRRYRVEPERRVPVFTATHPGPAPF